MIETMFEEIPETVRKKLAKVGVYSWSDISKKTKKEVKELKGIGPKSVLEIEYHMSKDKVKFKAPKKKYDTKTEDRKKVILHFIKQRSKIRWPMEMKNADRLLKEYNLEFLLTIHPKVDVYTLNYFYNPYIKKRLDSRYAKWKCEDFTIGETEEAVTFEEENVVEDRPIEKQKTLEDFLK